MYAHKNLIHFVKNTLLQKTTKTQVHTAIVSFVYIALILICRKTDREPTHRQQGANLKNIIKQQQTPQGGKTGK